MADGGQFAGKVVLVTGAGSGIGEACARAFAAEGARVILADIDLDAARRVAIDVGHPGSAAVQADVADPQSVERMVRLAVEAGGGLDIAVNNAGIAGERNPTGSYSLESWSRVIGVDLSGVFYCMRYQIPAILARGGGAIVNVASVVGVVGYAGRPAYVAAKHGVVGLTRAAALEYATRGIRVNAVGPGFVATPFLGAGLDPHAHESIGGLHPMKRLGKPEEVAALVCFLASDAASFITGGYYPVDGGYTAQ